MKKIVSKTASKSKNKKNAYHCEFCVRKFASLSRLQEHHRNQHNLKPFRTRAKQYENATVTPEVKEKAVKQLEAKKTVDPTMSTKHTDEPNSTNTVCRAQNAEPATETPSSKVEFECPRCFLSFNTYTIAAQHIQKFHYYGRKVPMNIKPERKVLCSTCKRKVKSLSMHVCTSESYEEQNIVYFCLGCSKRFSTLRVYYTHVVTNHSDGVETLFFPTNTDLKKWILDVEYQTNGRYSDFMRVDSKYYCHCTRLCGRGTRMMNVCPSILVLQEFPKGIQINFYSQHFQHPCKDYKFTNKFQKFSITNYLRASDSYFQLKDLKSDDNDLYLQFKQLMESVVLDAAKLKKETLTVLFGCALEMTSILRAYDHDDELSDDGAKVAPQSMTATDIEKALEDTSMLDDASGSNPHNNKVSSDIESPQPMILNTFSLANTPDATKENNNTEVVKGNIKVKDLSSLQEPNEKTIDDTDTTPSSFNESFAVFLKKQCPKGDDLSTRRVTRSTKPSRFMKTKIGQYKPPSPKKLKPNTPQDVDNYISVISPSFQNSPKPEVPLHPAAQQTTITTTMDTQRKSNAITDIVQKVKSLNNVSIEVSKKKTNYTPNAKNEFISKGSIKEKPLNASTIKRDIKPKKDKPKVDIRYEVMEQEDDCNILILKI